jgi:hypothetical protein
LHTLIAVTRGGALVSFSSTARVPT